MDDRTGDLPLASLPDFLEDDFDEITPVDNFFPQYLEALGTSSNGDSSPRGNNPPGGGGTGQRRSTPFAYINQFARISAAIAAGDGATGTDQAVASPRHRHGHGLPAAQLHRLWDSSTPAAGAPPSSSTSYNAPGVARVQRMRGAVASGSELHDCASKCTLNGRTATSSAEGAATREAVATASGQPEADNADLSEPMHSQLRFSERPFFFPSHSHPSSHSPATPLQPLPTHYGGSNAGSLELVRDGSTVAPAGTGGGPSNGRSGRVKKTAAQAAAAKTSQRKYREGKKAKVAALERAVSCLKSKVVELNVAQKEKSELEARLGALELQVASKQEAQVPHSHTGSPPADHEKKPEREVAEANVTELCALFNSAIESVLSFLKQHGYHKEASVTYATLPAQQREHLRSMVHLCFTCCVRSCELVSEVDIFAMLRATRGTASAKYDSDPERWLLLVHTLALDDSALAQAAAMHEQFIPRLEELYVEREQLNEEALRCLAPTQPGVPEVSGSPWCSQRKSSAAESHGAWVLLPRPRTASFGTVPHGLQGSVAGALSRIKDNLQEEQKILYQLACGTYGRLLDPLQSAKCMLDAYDEHCDFLALVNALRAYAAGDRPSSVHGAS